MARNGTFTIDDTTYKFDSNGKNTIKKFTPDDLVNFLNKKNIYRAKIHCPNQEEYGTFYLCTLSIPQGEGAPQVEKYK